MLNRYPFFIKTLWSAFTLMYIDYSILTVVYAKSIGTPF